MIDHNMLLSLKPNNAMKLFNDSLTTAQRYQQNKEYMGTADLRKQQYDNERQQNRFRSVVQGAIEASPYIGNKQAMLQHLQKRKQWLQSQGIPTNDTDEIISDLMTDENLAYRRIQNAAQMGQQMGFGGGRRPRSVRKTVNYKDGTSQSFYNDGSVEVRDGIGNILQGDSAREAIRLGVQSGVQQAYDRSYATTSGRNDADLEGRPDVVRAEEQVKADVQLDTRERMQEQDRDVAQTERDKVFKTYQNAIGAVEQTLGNTDSGYFVGLLPAVTASQRTADGAKSVILPILKSMFREAGEGVFTDKDQELLEGMIPTRQDPPEAIRTKLIMLDNVVRAKLNQPLVDELSGSIKSEDLSLLSDKDLEDAIRKAKEGQ